jgi:AraC family transcriptional regulator
MSAATRTPEFSDGQIVRRLDFAEMTLGEVHYTGEHSRPTHSHERACFHFLLDGGYTEYYGGQVSDCRPLSLSYQPSGHEHSYRCSKKASKSLTMEVEPAWLNRLEDHSVVLDRVCNFRDGLLLWLVTRLYKEFWLMQPESELLIEGLALEIAVEVSRSRKKPAPHNPPLWLKQVIEMVNDQFTESLTLREIAQSVGIHPVHLARTFRQQYGCTVGDYVRKRRIEFACRQVAHSHMSLPEIAQAAGFSDQSQFNRTFKRLMGITPGAFRAATLPR